MSRDQSINQLSVNSVKKATNSILSISLFFLKIRQILKRISALVAAEKLIRPRHICIATNVKFSTVVQIIVKRSEIVTRLETTNVVNISRAEQQVVTPKNAMKIKNVLIAKNILRNTMTIQIFVNKLKRTIKNTFTVKQSRMKSKQALT